jgi:hypothetical protein
MSSFFYLPNTVVAQQRLNTTRRHCTRFITLCGEETRESKKRQEYAVKRPGRVRSGREGEKEKREVNVCLSLLFLTERRKVFFVRAK